MKALVLFGVLVAAILQIDARSIALQNDELPKALREIMGQSLSCGMELGPSKLAGIPSVAGLTHFPEDNPALNALWGCIYKKKEIANGNSEINKTKLEAYLWDIAEMVGKTSSQDRTDVVNLAKECAKVEGQDVGQTAVKIENCAMKYFKTSVFRA